MGNDDDRRHTRVGDRSGQHIVRHRQRDLDRAESPHRRRWSDRNRCVPQSRPVHPLGDDSGEWCHARRQSDICYQRRPDCHEVQSRRSRPQRRPGDAVVLVCEDRHVRPGQQRHHRVDRRPQCRWSQPLCPHRARCPARRHDLRNRELGQLRLRPQEHHARNRGPRRRHAEPRSGRDRQGLRFNVNSRGPRGRERRRDQCLVEHDSGFQQRPRHRPRRRHRECGQFGPRRLGWRDGGRRELGRDWDGELRQQRRLPGRPPQWRQQ